MARRKGQEKRADITRVFLFGLLPPTENAALVREQMRLGQNYRNVLTEIERGRRAAHRALMSDQPDIGAMEALVAAALGTHSAAVASLKAARAKSRSKSETPTHVEAVATAKANLKSVRATMFAAKKAIRVAGTVKAEGSAIETRAHAMRRAANTSRGALFWGTSQLADMAAEASRNKTMKEFGYDEEHDPRFRRFSGEGRVGVQIQTQPFLATDALGTGTIVRIGPQEKRQQTTEKSAGVSAHRAANAARKAKALANGGGSTAELATLSLRVSSDGRAPVWARWPMVLDRPFPVGATISRVSVGIRKHGPHDVWSAAFTVRMPDIAAAPPTRGGTLAIDASWTTVPGALRAATWQDDSGDSGYVELDAEMIEHLTKASGLAKTRKDNFNVALASLVAWMATAKVPAWFAEATKTIAQWESQRRLAALVHQWRDQRWDGDGDGYVAAEAWRYHDHHLWAWESGQRRGSLLRRREQYRVFARQMADQYESLALSEPSAAKMAKKHETELRNETADSNRHLVATSELRLALEQAFRSSGRKITRVPCAGLSVTCPECGESDKAHREPGTHMFACSSCTFARDIDKVSTLNMLRAVGCGDRVDAIIERGKRAASSVATEVSEEAPLLSGGDNDNEGGCGALDCVPGKAPLISGGETTLVSTLHQEAAE